MGNCVKKVVVKGDKLNNQSKSSKPKEFTLKDEIEEVSFVDILHNDGNISQYVYSPPPPVQSNSSEVLNLCAETIDQKQTSVQISASEKVSALKQKVCESLSLNEILLIFDGKVLDTNDVVGNIIPQGSTLDIIVL
ncbi:hypothetical protein SteCoe_35156 [Stentor coeruleus]|uniref:Ubiquitin-like domain-containing protein n=1 Tax=Stentor coeruleus TaxID=5963 RepID=A0A1R2AT45_9CILI|nr:hypothetical protein SteCoe_35156 [Stentor coeruleus]